MITSKLNVSLNNDVNLPFNNTMLHDLVIFVQYITRCITLTTSARNLKQQISVHTIFIFCLQNIRRLLQQQISAHTAFKDPIVNKSLIKSKVYSESHLKTDTVQYFIPAYRAYCHNVIFINSHNNLSFLGIQFWIFQINLIPFM